AGGLARLAVAYEDVVDRVRVAADEVARSGIEGDEAPVGGDRVHDALAFGLRAVGVDAYSGGLAGLAVAHEDVRHAIRIARDEVGRIRVEGDEAPVRGDRRAPAVPGALRAVRVDADARGPAGLAIAHEDVPRAVRVAPDEVGRIRVEGHEAP